MFFFFICGEKTFRKDVPGYEGIVCQCHNCGNMSGHVLKSNPWFTFCFIVSVVLRHATPHRGAFCLPLLIPSVSDAISRSLASRGSLSASRSVVFPCTRRMTLTASPQPLIPFSIHGYKDVACHICSFHQPLENRPDVMAMANGGAGGGGGQQQPPYQQPYQQQPPPPPPQRQQYG